APVARSRQHRGRDRAQSRRHQDRRLGDRSRARRRRGGRAHRRRRTPGGYRPQPCEPHGRISSQVAVMLSDAALSRFDGRNRKADLYARNDDMYLPKMFEENDAATLREFIRCHPLATLVSQDANGLCADHIPMLLETGNHGATLLCGHVARANPLWRNLGNGASVLAIFQDAGGYITPSWYASKKETGKVVPTWNYV